MDSKHIEIRHNSPNVIDFFLSGNSQLLLDSAKEIINILTPIIADISNYITVGATMVTVGKVSSKWLNKKFSSQKAESISSNETNYVRKELENLRKEKIEKMYLEYQQNNANSSIPYKELMNLQKKLQNEGIIINDIDIQYLNGESDVMNILYQNSTNTTI